MSRQGRFSAFLILILLISTFVAAPHYHQNTADDHDCPICVVSHHQNATSQSTIFFDGIPCFMETTFLAPASSFADNLFSFSRNNRAPPA